jgi:hypothetical protein
VKDECGHGSISTVSVLSPTTKAVVKGKLFLLCALVDEKARGKRQKVWERAVEGADLHVK